jgi:hypothetical protein
LDRTTLSLDQIKSLLPGLPDREGFSDRLYLCKTGPLTGQFAVDTIWDPAIDEQSMTVRMRLKSSNRSIVSVKSKTKVAPKNFLPRGTFKKYLSRKSIPIRHKSKL